VVAALLLVVVGSIIWTIRDERRLRRGEESLLTRWIFRIWSRPRDLRGRERAVLAAALVAVFGVGIIAGYAVARVPSVGEWRDGETTIEPAPLALLVGGAVVAVLGFVALLVVVKRAPTAEGRIPTPPLSPQGLWAVSLGTVLTLCAGLLVAFAASAESERRENVLIVAVLVTALVVVLAVPMAQSLLGTRSSSSVETSDEDGGP
jgi:hypothetical protein